MEVNAIDDWNLSPPFIRVRPSKLLRLWNAFVRWDCWGFGVLQFAGRHLLFVGRYRGLREGDGPDRVRWTVCVGGVFLARAES